MSAQYRFLLSCSLCICCFFCVSAANAETLHAGDTEITYTVPHGYIEGKAGPYLEMRDFINRALPAQMVLQKLYISAALEEKKDDQPKAYFFLATLRPLDNVQLDIDTFATMKKSIIAAQEKMNMQIKDDAGKLVDQASGGTLSIDAIKNFGIFDESDSSISFIALADQMYHGEKTQKYTVLVISTTLLSHGKVVLINHYKAANLAEDMQPQMNAFKKEAMRLVDDLHIARDGNSNFLYNLLFGLFIGGLAGSIYAWIQKRRKTVAQANSGNKTENKAEQQKQ